MSKRSGLLVIVVLALAAAVVVQAAAPKMHEATGRLRSIDTTTSTIVVETLKGHTTFKLEQNVVVTDHEGTLRLSDLQGGERVRVQYTKQGKDMLVGSIKVLAGSDTAPAKKKAEGKKKPGA